jgi:hypothetical protein
MMCELEFKKLNQQTDFKNKVEPLFYTAKFCLGVLCVILSSLTLFLVIFGMFNFYLSSENNATIIQPSDLLNTILKWLGSRGLGYIQNIIFISLAGYLLAVTFHGNQTIGFRFASPTFYPMRPNET